MGCKDTPTSYPALMIEVKGLSIAAGDIWGTDFLSMYKRIFLDSLGVTLLISKCIF